jgi:hypothetical protein
VGELVRGEDVIVPFPGGAEIFRNGFRGDFCKVVLCHKVIKRKEQQVAEEGIRRRRHGVALGIVFGIYRHYIKKAAQEQKRGGHEAFLLHIIYFNLP